MYILLSVNPFLKTKLSLFYIKYRLIHKLNILKTDYSKAPSKIYCITGIVWICEVIASQAMRTIASFPHSKDTARMTSNSSD